MSAIASLSASEAKIHSTEASDSITSAVISDSFIKDDIVYYRVIVKRASGLTMTIRKRYRHFQNLHETLSKYLTSEKLPALPRKQSKALVDHTSREFVYERQFQMNNYFQDIFTLAGADNQVQSLVQRFFSSHVLSEDNTHTVEELHQERSAGISRIRKFSESMMSLFSRSRSQSRYDESTTPSRERTMSFTTNS